MKKHLHQWGQYICYVNNVLHIHWTIDERKERLKDELHRKQRGTWAALRSLEKAAGHLTDPHLRANYSSRIFWEIARKRSDATGTLKMWRPTGIAFERCPLKYNCKSRQRGRLERTPRGGRKLVSRRWTHQLFDSHQAHRSCQDHYGLFHSSLIWKEIK